MRGRDVLPMSGGPAGRDDVEGAYDRWAGSYDVDRNATRDLDAIVLRRQPLELAGRDVLELGCGTGKNTAWLAERARRVVAMDLSVGMLAKARARVVSPLVQFVRHDVRTPWPVRDGAFDVVVGNLVLEHVADLAPVFAEGARVLRDGGQLYLCELHPFRQWRGAQARFTDDATGEVIRIPSHVHAVADYVNGGLDAGLELRRLGEWLEDAAAPGSPPRLLSALFRR